MSGPRLSAVDRDGANLVPPTSDKIVGNTLEFPHGLEERAGPKASTDDKPADPVSNVNQAINDFDFWGLLQKNRRVQYSTCSHNLHPAITLTRQVKGGPERVTASLTCLNKTAQNGERFQWVPNRDAAFRQTVVADPTQGSAR